MTQTPGSLGSGDALHDPVPGGQTGAPSRLRLGMLRRSDPFQGSGSGTRIQSPRDNSCSMRGD